MKKGNRAVPQVLIKWTKLPSTSATWEDFYVLQQHFPNALAWGHARSLGGADVMTGGQTDAVKAPTQKA